VRPIDGRPPVPDNRSRNRSGIRQERTMADNRHVLYTAEAHVTGGRAAGHGRTSDGSLEVDLRAPRELGGQGGGTNPEELFAIGYAACFESALGAVARRRHVEPGDVAIDARVMLLRARDRSFTLAVALVVTLPAIDDPAQAVELVRAGHAVCPYSNATLGNIDVTLTANGRPVTVATRPRQRRASVRPIRDMVDNVREAMSQHDRDQSDRAA
jgi:osmotically inducible protein OsmC